MRLFSSRAGIARQQFADGTTRHYPASPDGGRQMLSTAFAMGATPTASSNVRVVPASASLLGPRVEAAFDRFNRAAIAGVEPKASVFIEALEAEGLSIVETER